MHQSCRKAYKLRESLTVSKILLLFSMCLTIHFIHKCTAIDKITCLKKLIGICFTAFLLPVIPLASCFDCSGNKIDPFHPLTQQNIQLEVKLVCETKHSTVFKNCNVILASRACIQQQDCHPTTCPHRLEHTRKGSYIHNCMRTTLKF